MEEMTTIIEREISLVCVALDEAREQAYALKCEIDEKTRAIKAKYQILADAECDDVRKQYAERHKAISDKVARLGRELDELKIEAAKEKTLGGVPIGGKVIEWNAPRYGRGKETPTGKVGVVELCTRETLFPENCLHGRPDPGDLFVRILKKNGEPSLKYAGRWSIGGGLPFGWYPEGVDPNA